MAKHIEGATLNPLNLSAPVYDGIKNIALVVLPGLGTLYFALASIWGLPAAEQVLGTIAAIDTFLGLLVGVNKAIYKNSERAFDGVIRTTETDEGRKLQALWKEPVGELAEKKDVLTLRVEDPTTSQ